MTALLSFAWYLAYPQRRQAEDFDSDAGDSLASVRNTSGLKELTPRECEVYFFIAEGLSTNEIAAAGHIEETTVKSHISSILSKLGLALRTAIVAHAYRNGFLLSTSAATPVKGFARGLRRSPTPGAASRGRPRAPPRTSQFFRRLAPRPQPHTDGPQTVPRARYSLRPTQLEAHGRSQLVVATPHRYGVLLMPGSQVHKDRQARFWSLIREGSSSSAACEAVGVNRRQGYRWIKAAGGRIPVPRPPSSGRYLAQDDRLRIADLRINGAGVREIARRLGRAPSTISRELARNSRENAGAYRPYAAQKRCDLRARRPKSWRLDDPVLAAAVEERLVKNWSPEQISDDLARSFPDRPEMQVSHETIYQTLFVQGRGHLRADLHKNLRTGRAARRPRGQGFTAKGKIRDKVMISERPAEAADRAVPGHWESQCLCQAVLSVGISAGS
jgi:DNA-binding CsgD family transcriptional regulator/transposase-like protein